MHACLQACLQVEARDEALHAELQEQLSQLVANYSEKKKSLLADLLPEVGTLGKGGEAIS
jgi:hypothetical protein